MTRPLAASVFSEPNRYLRVWFSATPGGPFDQLAPDTLIAAVPYALQAHEAVNADTVDGLHANELRSNYQNVVVVAKSGGDYASVQAAIGSISDAAADNAYLVWVAPGVYVEQVTMKPYVHLQGAGQEVTVITSDASSSVWPPTEATLVLASDVSLRDLTVGNTGAGESNLALLATAGMTRTLVADVTARALGDGVGNNAIVLLGSGTGVRLQRLAALAENGSGHNVGLLNSSGAAAVVHSGAYTARGGEKAWAIFTSGSGTTLKAVRVSALAENASVHNSALYIYSGPAAVVRGGDFTGRGGSQAGGVQLQLNATLTAEDITALAENGTDNYGLGNFDGTAMTVRGATVTARGGQASYAVTNELHGATLDAESVTALAEDGSTANYGMYNAGGSGDATLRGGSFTAHGGAEAWGVFCDGNDITLKAHGVTALAENASTTNYGLWNLGGAETTLRGGSFTGRGGGADSYGIYNCGTGTKVEAVGVTALAEDGNNNFGLYNCDGAAMADSSQFTGSSHALYLDGGTVRLGVSQLDGGVTRESGTLTCFQVYDGSYVAYTCP